MRLVFLSVLGLMSPTVAVLAPDPGIPMPTAKISPADCGDAAKRILIEKGFHERTYPQLKYKKAVAAALNEAIAKRIRQLATKAHWTQTQLEEFAGSILDDAEYAKLKADSILPSGDPIDQFMAAIEVGDKSRAAQSLCEMLVAAINDSEHYKAITDQLWARIVILTDAEAKKRGFALEN